MNMEYGQTESIVGPGGGAPSGGQSPSILPPPTQEPTYGDPGWYPSQRSRDQAARRGIQIVGDQTPLPYGWERNISPTPMPRVGPSSRPKPTMRRRIDDSRSRLGGGMPNAPVYNLMPQQQTPFSPQPGMGGPQNVQGTLDPNMMRAIMEWLRMIGAA
jgi:hypothetical protein